MGFGNQRATHVDAGAEVRRDPGSIPGASIFQWTGWRNTPPRRYLQMKGGRSHRQHRSSPEGDMWLLRSGRPVSSLRYLLAHPKPKCSLPAPRLRLCIPLRPHPSDNDPERVAIMADSRQTMLCFSVRMRNFGSDFKLPPAMTRSTSDSCSIPRKSSGVVERWLPPPRTARIAIRA